MNDWIKRGQKVVCIRDDFIPRDLHMVYPQKGETYTIRDYIHVPNMKEIGLYFVEIVNPITPIRDLQGVMAESGFAHTCFRPVQATNIDWAYKILKEAENTIPVVEEVEEVTPDEGWTAVGPSPQWLKRLADKLRESRGD